MEIRCKLLGFLLLISMLISDCVTAPPAKCKSRYLKEKDYPFTCKVTSNEYFRFDDPLAEDAPQWSIYRTDFGLVAKNVKNVWASSELESVYLSTKKNEIREVDFSHWKKKGEIRYKTSLISDNKEQIFSPSHAECYLKNKKGEVFYTAYGTCYSVWEHHSREECKKEYEKLVKDKKVLSGVKRCWSGSGMFAYIQNNSLKITGHGKEEDQDIECYERWEPAESYFEGKGNRIKEVVCTGMSYLYGQEETWCIFVLMKDGSVWGMGNNKCKMLSNKRKTYREDFDFVKIISGGVDRIEAGGNCVAMIKKDKTLWTWGRDMRTTKLKYSFKPIKVADGVEEVSIGARGEYMLILKTNHTAYGLGGGYLNHVFTKNNTKKWYAEPVRLMGNVKHVYAAGEYGMTLLLTRNNELYWTGKAPYNWLYYEWLEGKKWKLPKLERKNKVEDKKTLKMIGVWRW